MKELPSWQLKRTAPGGRAGALDCGADSFGAGAGAAGIVAIGALAAGATPDGPSGCTVIGALGAIGQQNIKRLLAYSSINNVGFILVGQQRINTTLP